MDRLTKKIISYGQRLEYERLPAEVIDEAKRRTIDAIGCALGAILSEPSKVVRQVIADIECAGQATILGTGRRTSPDLAALANGAMIRYLDYNDTYLAKEACHPSDNISAALAVAESKCSSGQELINAIVLSYEIICRLCDAANLRDRGWDHATYGSFSTALAAAKMMNLSTEEMRNALALAVIPNNALRQTRVGELSMWKGVAFANTSRNGIFAAKLAQHGMTGPYNIFEGEKGFCKHVSGPLNLYFDDNEYRILKTSIKKYPAEIHSQAAIEAALALREKGIDLENIEEIFVSTYDVAVEIIGNEKEKWRPTNRETADHSLPYCVAVALTDGNVTKAQFRPSRISDPKLHKLMEKINVNEDPKISERYPQELGTKIQINYKSGDDISKFIGYPAGHWKKPMSDSEVEDKFRSLAGQNLPSKQVDKILEVLWNLEQVKDISELISLCTFDRSI